MIFKISTSMQIKCFFISAALAAAMYKTILNLNQVYFTSGVAFMPTSVPVVNYFIIVLLVLIPITAIHELIHGAFYRIFGGRPVYGFKGVYAYTMESTNKPIPRNSFLILMLAPVTVISFVCAFIPGVWGSVVMVLNLLGSSGDIYMAWGLRKLPPGCSIIDRSFGYEAII
jgi:hypothetical protein